MAERAGFTREAVLRSYMQGTYERQDMVAFGLLARRAAAVSAARISAARPARQPPAGLGADQFHRPLRAGCPFAPVVHDRGRRAPRDRDLADLVVGC